MVEIECIDGLPTTLSNFTFSDVILTQIDHSESICAGKLAITAKHGLIYCIVAYLDLRKRAPIVTYQPPITLLP